MEDKRFAIIARDPRFHRMKRKDRKVTIDKRFHGMFNDERFKLKYTVDKRGRPVKTTTDENLQKYYDLSEEESGDSESDEEGEKLTKRSNKKALEEGASNEEDGESSSEEGDDLEEEEVELSSKSEKKTKSKKKDEALEDEDGEDDDEDQESSEDDAEGNDLARGVGNEETSSEESEGENEDGIDLARGEGNIETSSSEESESEEEDEDFDHKWGELHYTAPNAEEVTSRLAVCNMDWDRIKANDIYVLLSSFISTGGVITKISIYPSEFGKKRMEEEDVKGPKELVERGPDDDQLEEGSVAQREKMRQYQLNRLRYFYAVAEFDKTETANSIYEQCDGIEYESSGTRMDLRFIPDGMEFDDDPKSVATSMPDSSTYKPSQFITTALQQSKVDLTWDETDKDRTAVTMRKFSKEDLEKLDMKDYLASSSDSEEEDPYANFLEKTDYEKAGKDESDEKVLEQYNEIIKMAKGKGSKKEKKSDVGMEISWDPDLMEDAENKKLKKSSGTETPWEQYLVQKKERKKKNRQKKKADKTEENGEAKNATDSKKTKSKKGVKAPVEDAQEEDEAISGDDAEDNEQGGDAFSDDDLPSDIDMADDFFKEELGQSDKAPVEKKKKYKKGKGKQPSEEEKKKMAELALLMDEDDNRQHFNLKDIMEKDATNLSKTKRKKLKKIKKKLEQQGGKAVEDTFEVNVSDPRFDDLFKNALYNIDPSASEFKATKATDALIQEKLRRRQLERKTGSNAKAKKRQADNNSEELSAKKQAKEEMSQTKDLSLASLVKSVKAKTQTLKQKKRR